MKTIQVSEFLSTNLIPDFSSVITIEIEDKFFNEGAYGEVYLCLTVNQKSLSIPQVIKIFKEDNNNRQDHNVETIQKLQRKLSEKSNELLKQNLGSLIDKYPALKGVPQFSFTGILEGKTVRGFSSSNLKKLGFEEFIDILEDDKLYRPYQSLGIDKKMLIAYRLVSAFKLLNEIYFIHADLKPEAIFINTANAECAIIDFDSGTITEKITDEPNVWGSPNDWIAPEIWEQLKQQTTNGLQKVKVNLLSDLWSVCVGVHYILTTTHPLFYLNELSPRATNHYFSKYKWPNINVTESYFNQNNSTIYQPINNWLQSVLPKAIFNELSNTINYGYRNPIKRTTYKEWEKVLLSVQEPPKITSFFTDREAVINGVSAKLSWVVSEYYQLFLNDGKSEIEITNQKNIEVKPKDDTIYRLIAKGHFGTVESEKLEIRVFPIPLIKTIFVPTPQFNQTTLLSNISISSPQVNMPIELNTSLFQTNEIEFTKLSDDARKLILNKDEKNSLSIADIFDLIREEVNEKVLKKFKLKIK